MKFKISSLLIILLLLGSTLYAFYHIRTLEKQLTIANDNIAQIDKQNQSLILSKKQMSSWLKAKDTKFKQSIDSLAQAYKVSLKEVAKASSTEITYSKIRPDTIYVPIKFKGLTIEKQDTLYTSSFIDSTRCYSIAGVIKSSDKSPRISLTAINFKTEVLSITYKKRPQWWKFWKWFSKRKVESVTVATCGNVETKSISQEN